MSAKDFTLSSGRSNEKRFRNGRSHQPVMNGGVGALEVSSSVTIEHAMQEAGISTVASVPQELPVKNHGRQDDEQIAAKLSKCQSDLNQKDELITALIHELEQAVEQLDRYERTGVDRKPLGQSVAASSAAIDISGLNLPFMDNLQRMVEEWEQTQPTSILGRIESQLASVHDLVLNLQRSGQSRDDSIDVEERIRRINSAPVEASEQDTVNMTLDESSPTWEAIKNQLLGIQTPSPSQTFEESDKDSELLQLMSETPTPEAVDFQTANHEELKTAIIERDSYIIQLNRLFRTRNSLSLPTDWATLANVPGEMQVRVESLIEHLNVQVRLGEVEMSLERARLARERSQIQSEREHIEKHLRRLGLNSIADLDNISQATGSSGDRRWMRFLGPNTK